MVKLGLLYRAIIPFQLCESEEKSSQFQAADALVAFAGLRNILNLSIGLRR